MWESRQKPTAWAQWLSITSVSPSPQPALHYQGEEVNKIPNFQEKICFTF